MTWIVELLPRAARDLRGLDPPVQRRLAAAMDQRAQDPRPSAARQLVGDPAWRLRVGDYRVIYEIHDQVVRVLVLRVARRREVYRR